MVDSEGVMSVTLCDRSRMCDSMHTNTHTQELLCFYIKVVTFSTRLQYEVNPRRSPTAKATIRMCLSLPRVPM